MGGGNVAEASDLRG